MVSLAPSHPSLPAGRQFSTEPSSGAPIFVSNPDGLHRHNMKSGRIEMDVNADSEQPTYRRTRTMTVTLMPLDRPDSLYPAGMSTLAWHDRKMSQLLPSAEEQVKFLNALEKQTGLSNQLDPALLASVSKLSLAEENNVPPTGTGGDESRRSSICTESSQPPSPASPVVACMRRLVRIYDLSLFANGTFLFLATAFVFVQLAYFVPFVYLFGYAVESGLQRGETMIMTTVMGVLHIVGRLVGGILANVPKVNILLLTVASYFLVASCHIALPFLPPTFTILTIYAGSFGFLCAVPCPLQPLICVQYMGLNRLTTVLGNANLCKGVAAAIGPIVAAYIKDSTQQWDGVFFFCGSSYALTGLLHFLVYARDCGKVKEKF